MSENSAATPTLPVSPKPEIPSMTMEIPAEIRAAMLEWRLALRSKKLVDSVDVKICLEMEIRRALIRTHENALAISGEQTIVPTAEIEAAADWHRDAGNFAAENDMRGWLASRTPGVVPR